MSFGLWSFTERLRICAARFEMAGTLLLFDVYQPGRSKLTFFDAVPSRSWQ